MLRTPPTPASKKRRGLCHLHLEELEPRNLLSANPADVVAQNFLTVIPQYNSGQSPAGYWPSQIRHAYGFDKLSLDGTGQTIAIVDAYRDPNLPSDLDHFDQQFSVNGGSQSLYQQYGPSSTFLTKVNQAGGADSTVPTDSTGGWEVEEALDVEWAHAIAPNAKILLVEANSANLSDLLSAVSYATSQPNVVAVSMSWGSNEFSGQSSFDSYFTTPAGHKGITFTAASGDNGTPAGWPASSPNVLAVGGTSLSLSSTDTRVSEPGWPSSGGGYSAVYGTPSYQQSYAQSSYVQNTLNNHVLQAGSRGNPDVSYDASSSPGYAVYDTFPYYGTSYTWFSVGGTSAGSPQWAALVALADQQRGASGSLDGPSQTLPTLYDLASSSTTYPRDFIDVTSGSNGYSAQPGYDLVTGLGSPQANNLVLDLAGNSAPTSTVYFTVSAPSSATAGSAFSVTVTAHNPDGTVDTGYTGTVHFTSSDTARQVVLPADSMLTNGTGSFSVTLVTAGSQTITATDTVNSAITGSASVSVSAAEVASLTLSGFPSPIYAGTSGTFTVTARDAYGNIATSDNGTVTFTSSDPKASLPGASALHNGTGTFTATLNTPGTQSLTAQDSLGHSGSQTGIVVNAAPSTVTFTSGDVPAPILGGYATVSYLRVPSSVTIANLTVKLTISYPSDGDLAVALESPRGVVVYLSEFEGGFGANFQGTVFDSTADTPISSGTAPFAGTYQPDNSLLGFNGRNAQGTWQLWVLDYGFSSGALRSWSLTITPSSAAPIGPAFAPPADSGVSPNGQVPGVSLMPLPGATPTANSAVSQASGTNTQGNTALAALNVAFLNTGGRLAGPGGSLVTAAPVSLAPVPLGTGLTAGAGMGRAPSVGSASQGRAVSAYQARTLGDESPGAPAAAQDQAVAVDALFQAGLGRRWDWSVDDSDQAGAADALFQVLGQSQVGDDWVTGAGLEAGPGESSHLLSAGPGRELASPLAQVTVAAVALAVVLGEPRSPAGQGTRPGDFGARKRPH
jgi:subtilisin-like proprotein convertase family protein